MPTPLRWPTRTQTYNRRYGTVEPGMKASFVTVSTVNMTLNIDGWGLIPSRQRAHLFREGRAVCDISIVINNSYIRLTPEPAADTSPCPACKAVAAGKKSVNYARQYRSPREEVREADIESLYQPHHFQYQVVRETKPPRQERATQKKALKAERREQLRLEQKAQRLANVEEAAQRRRHQQATDRFIAAQMRSHSPRLTTAERRQRDLDELAAAREARETALAAIVPISRRRLAEMADGERVLYISKQDVKECYGLKAYELRARGIDQAFIDPDTTTIYYTLANISGS